MVVPVLNEKENLLKCITALKNLKNKYLKNKYLFEIIFTDNHSSDGSELFLKNFCLKNKNYKFIRFTRNVGYQRSILTGILNTNGAAILQFDCDLQDPIDVAAKLIKKWELGYKVVYGVRKKRKEFFAITLCRKTFYRIASALSETYLPLDAGDFRIIDKQVAGYLKKINDPNPYLRGYISSLGFKHTGIPYERNERKNGKSKFTYKKLTELALDGILSHSILPLQISSICGLIMSFLFFILFFGYLIASFFIKQEWPKGFATLALLSLLQASLCFTFIGVLGEYVGRIFRMLKKPDPIIVEESKNFKKRLILP